MRVLVIFFLIGFISYSCENRDINEGEEFRPREVNEDFQNFHFNRIVYDGVEYLITERDNNNPHEGFGFMAFSGTTFMQEQDSLMAYMKTNAEIQARIYARVFGVSDAAGDSLYQSIYSFYLQKERAETEARLSQITAAASQQGQDTEVPEE